MLVETDPYCSKEGKKAFVSCVCVCVNLMLGGAQGIRPRRSLEIYPANMHGAMALWHQIRAHPLYFYASTSGGRRRVCEVAV